MLTVYHSNQLELHKESLLHLLKNITKNTNPFEQDYILVQSKGMEKWLTMQIADDIGISSNIKFLSPSDFIREIYLKIIPNNRDLPQNIFSQQSLIWHLIDLIPECLSDPAFTSLKHYLADPNDQFKRYQLAEKIADLFDQYLMYRHQWLLDWEENKYQKTIDEIHTAFRKKGMDSADVEQNVKWQALLWKKVVDTLIEKEEKKLKSEGKQLNFAKRKDILNASHRAYMHNNFSKKLAHLTNEEKEKLPKNIFIFGISSFPYMQLEILKKLSEVKYHDNGQEKACHIHLFFANPSEQFWWGNNERTFLERQAVKNAQFSANDLQLFEDHHNLLAIWGKQGKEFLTLLSHTMANEIIYFDDILPPSSENVPNSNAEKKYNTYSAQANLPLLSQLKKSILQNSDEIRFQYQQTDHSIQFHLCHSEMREVEILHDQLLDLFAKEHNLYPKDIIVLSPDIDRYAPYINAVFSRYPTYDKRYIPFDISDQKATATKPIFNAFLHLLKMHQSQFSAEEILALLDVNAIQDKFYLDEEKIHTLRQWIKDVNIRFGLNTEMKNWQNYNAWQNGLNRLLLGTSLKEQQGIWQDTIAYNESYGLNAELVGTLSELISHLAQWKQFLQSSHPISAWHNAIHALINHIFADTIKYSDELNALRKFAQELKENVESTQFKSDDGNIEPKIIHRFFANKLENEKSELRFLAGKVNFATLLPMRAIPFKVICLLGMNEADFPRQINKNSFDLMQYAPRLGDRARREDDRYLFLESVLAAQEVLYISYIGRDLKDNKPLLPSIVVTQLYDYLKNHFEDEMQLEAFNENNHIVHFMSMLNPNNFRDGHFSYRKEWQRLITHSAKNPPHFQDFANVIHTSENTLSEMTLNELIQFIHQPVKFFFNKQLGVYFGEQDESISETENFTLNGLQNYQLKDSLLAHHDESQFFKMEKLKGNLTAAQFADLTQESISAEILPLKTKLQSYFEQIPESRQIKLHFDNLILNGHLHSIYGNEIIHWRIGKLRDKDLITAWIYHLCFCALNYTESYRYFYVDKATQEVNCLRFHSLSSEIAHSLLKQYIVDFIRGQQQLFITVNNDIQTYINKLPEQELENYCYKKLHSFEDPYNTAAQYDTQLPYLKRYLMQTHQVDYAQIHQQTIQWYDEMIKQIAGE